MNLPARNLLDLQKTYLSMRVELEAYLKRRLRDPELAQDMVNEVCVKIEEARNRGEIIRDNRAYVFRMAVNLFKDHVKLTRRRAEILEESGDLLEPMVPTPEREVIARADLGIVDAALAELPPRAREILFQSRINGMTHDQIATELGVSRSSVEKYIMRALGHCRQRLREAETISEPRVRLPVRKR